MFYGGLVINYMRLRNSRYGSTAMFPVCFVLWKGQISLIDFFLSIKLISCDESMTSACTTDKHIISLPSLMQDTEINICLKWPFVLVNDCVFTLSGALSSDYVL